MHRTALAPPVKGSSRLCRRGVEFKPINYQLLALRCDNRSPVGNGFIRSACHGLVGTKIHSRRERIYPFRLYRFCLHPPVGLTQIMYRHNVKTPLRPHRGIRCASCPTSPWQGRRKEPHLITAHRIGSPVKGSSRLCRRGVELKNPQPKLHIAAKNRQKPTPVRTM